MAQKLGNDDIAPGVALLDYVVARGLARPTRLGAAAGLIERAIIQGGVRAAMSAPPYHGKRTLAEHAAAMALEMRRTIDIGYFTGDHAGAQRAATAIARTTRVGMCAVDERGTWRSADGGTLLAGTIGSDAILVGSSFDLVFIVNQVKNGAEAADTARLAAHWQWLQRVRSRISPWGSIIILAPRWCAADMIGHALRDGRWEHLNFPALDARGEALFPELWSARVLDQIHECIGEAAWTALYLGKPTDERRVLTARPALAVAER